MSQYYIEYEYGQFKIFCSYEGSSPYIIAWSDTLEGLFRDAQTYLGRKITIPIMVAAE